VLALRSREDQVHIRLNLLHYCLRLLRLARQSTAPVGVSL